MNSIIYYDLNQHKYKNYITYLNDSYFENNLNIAIAIISIKRNHISNSYIYSNIEYQ